MRRLTGTVGAGLAAFPRHISKGIIAFFYLLACSIPSGHADDYRGSQFIGFTEFIKFQRQTNHSGVVLNSVVEPAIKWTELVPSWNYTGTNGLTIEIRVLFPDHKSGWYDLGHWTAESADFKRESVKDQSDADGRVATDTLELSHEGGPVEVRVALHGTTELSGLRLLGLSFCDARRQEAALLPAEKRAWGLGLVVPERSQADFPEGISSWCSPTSLSMLLAFWARELNRFDLDHAVPAVARGVNDPNWPGTGNWPFNTAFAGHHAGIRAYVSRLSDVRELEQWILSGVPVATSVSYNLLKGKTYPGNGHLVVCIGFTEAGDPIFNDPGRRQVRQTYKRENFIRAWAASNNTVYFVYPANHNVPEDLFSHWLREP